MTSSMRNSVALVATTLALAGSIAVAGPAHGDARGPQPVPTASSAPTHDSDASAAAVKKIRIKGTHVALRECPRKSCGVAIRVSNATLRAYCQTNRHTSKVAGNKWWTKVTLLSGSDPAWVSNHYVRGAAPKVPHLPDC
ncbi:hypothetical protein [Streptomyces cyanogenus]|uniref:SH3 domain-containing protein n=1 Tax=Streptomyces cyanogenus TaxID=80860 RepID=A0ABX7THV7_STRCY|nr:hypothetical protein [Streptomyces cyanogenus]QTD96084.1 hypothetical protein S1361_01935 [Streptomyces cyanogenus]